MKTLEKYDFPDFYGFFLEFSRKLPETVQDISGKIPIKFDTKTTTRTTKTNKNKTKKKTKTKQKHCLGPPSGFWYWRSPRVGSGTGRPI